MAFTEEIIYTIKTKGGDRVIKSQGDLKAAIKAVNEELDDGVKIGSKRYQELQNELGKLKGIQKEVRKDTKQSADQFQRTALTAQGSYDQLSATLRDLKAQYRGLSKESRDSFDGKQLEKQIRGVNDELKRLDKGLGDNFRNVGNYESALSGAFKSLKGGLVAAGFAVGVSEVVDVGRDAVRVYADFVDKIAKLKGITGASQPEIEALENDARRLGESTQFTASQVAELQTEFARGGFSTSEILAATEATLDLAAATGEDLTKASEVVVNGIRGFGLEADQTSEFVDTLTKTLNTSTNRLESYAEAAKFISPISKTLGISVAETSAAIGLLADNGLKGSVATRTIGTALQRLADDTKVYAKEAEKAGITVFNQQGQFVGLTELIRNFETATEDLTDKERLATANRIFSAEAAKNFLVLLDAEKKLQTETGEAVLKGADALGAYTEALENASGTAGKTAETALDSLQGDILKTQSAFEGLQIKIVKLFDKPLRAITTAIGKLFGSIGTALEFLFKTFQPVIGAVKNLFSAIFGGIDTGSLFTKVLDNIAKGVIFATNTLTFLINGLARYIEFGKRVIKETPLLSGAFDILKVVIGGIIDGLSKLPSLANGVLFAVKQLFSNISNFDFSVGIGEAFRKGFQETEDWKKRIGQEVENTGKIIKESGKNVEGEAGQTGEDIGLEVGKGVGKGIRKSAPLIEGSIKFLEDKLSKLKAVVESAPPGEGLEGTLKEIADTEKELQEVKTVIDEIRAGLQAEELLDAANLGTVIADTASQLGTDLASASEEGLQSLDDKLKEGAKKEIKRLERQREQALSILNKRVDDEEAYQEQRSQIEFEYGQQILAQRLALEEIGSTEYLRIRNEMYEREREYNKEKNDAIATQEEQLRQLLLKTGIDIAGKLANAQIEIELTRVQRQKDIALTELEEEQEQRLAVVEEGSAEEERLLAEFEQRRVEIERQAAKKAQALQIRQAIINTALAIGSALATVKPFFPAGVLAASVAAIEGGAQVAAIRSQSFHTGGYTGSGYGAADASGLRPAGIVHAGEYVVPPKVVRHPQGVKVLKGLERLRLQLGYPKAPGRMPGYAEGGPVGFSFPASSAPGAAPQSIVVTAEIGEASTRRIAEGVQQGARSGTSTGAAIGLNDGLRLRERQAIRDQRLEN